MHESPELDWVPPTLRSTPHELPFGVFAFTGRTEELDALGQLLAENEGDQSPTMVISAVSGTAGVGKTALALHWAHQVADRFPDGQLHVDLRSHGPEPAVQPGDVFAAFLRSPGVNGA